MYSVKGFLSIAKLIDNAPGQTSQLGELSMRAQTYSTEKTYHSNNGYPGIRLTVFSSKGTSGQHVVPEEWLTDKILAVFDTMLSYSDAGTITVDKNTVYAMVGSVYPEIRDTFNVGTMRTVDSNTLPDFVEWEEAGTEVKIWLNATSFEEQYDEYEIATYSPVTNLNDLHRPYGEIISIFDVDTSTMLTAVNEGSKAKPYTMLKMIMVDWEEKNMAQPVTKQLPFIVTIYGRNGDNPDAINQALTAYILANSIYNSLEWYDVLPKLFNPSEFLMVPLWDAYAINELSLKEGVYSPISTWARQMEIAGLTMSEYTQEWLDDNLTIMPTVYKQVSVLSVGSTGNIQNIYQINQRWPDYIPVPPTNPDFQRQSSETQEFSRLFYDMLYYAERLSGATVLPPNMAHMSRNGRSYIIASYGGANYVILSKTSYNDILEEAANAGA